MVILAKNENTGERSISTFFGRSISNVLGAGKWIREEAKYSQKFRQDFMNNL